MISFFWNLSLAPHKPNTGICHVITEFKLIFLKIQIPATFTAEWSKKFWWQIYDVFYLLAFVLQVALIYLKLMSNSYDIISIIWLIYASINKICDSHVMWACMDNDNLKELQSIN
jgi:hypothetical protein